MNNNQETTIADVKIMEIFDKIADVCLEEMDKTNSDFIKVFDFIYQNEIDRINELIDWFCKDYSMNDDDLKFFEDNKNIFRYSMTGMIVDTLIGGAKGVNSAT